MNVRNVPKYYRPPATYVRAHLFAYAFTFLGFAAVGLCILARLLGWVK